MEEDEEDRKELVHITPSRGSAREGWYSSSVYLGLYDNSDNQPLKSFKLGKSVQGRCLIRKQS